jgi:hypothetical protein
MLITNRPSGVSHCITGLSCTLVGSWDNKYSWNLTFLSFLIHLPVAMTEAIKMKLAIWNSARACHFSWYLYACWLCCFTWKMIFQHTGNHWFSDIVSLPRRT